MSESVVESLAKAWAVEILTPRGIEAPKHNIAELKAHTVERVAEMGALAADVRRLEAENERLRAALWEACVKDVA